MKSKWNDWSTVHKVEDKEVLVKFKMPDGSYHIEDAFILSDMETDDVRGESRHRRGIRTSA